jgi:uncharacterized protein YggE
MLHSFCSDAHAHAQGPYKGLFIAKQSGVKLGVITTINYSEHQVTRPMMAMEDASMSYVSKSSMMDFEQTVSVTSNISINFEIIE